MFKDFSKFKFTVIDVEASNNSPEVVINCNGITFNQCVLDMLGNPEYVRPMVDMENKVFAVQVAKDKDGSCLNFNKNQGKKNGYSSTCTAIRMVLRKLMADKWDENLRYRMEGVHFADAKAVAFDLNSAKELQPLKRK